MKRSEAMMALRVHGSAIRFMQKPMSEDGSHEIRVERPKGSSCFKDPSSVLASHALCS